MRKVVLHLPDRGGVGRPRRLFTDTKYRKKLIALSADHTITELMPLCKASYGTIQRDLDTLKKLADKQAKGKKEA